MATMKVSELLFLNKHWADSGISAVIQEGCCTSLHMLKKQKHVQLVHYFCQIIRAGCSLTLVLEITDDMRTDWEAEKVKANECQTNLSYSLKMGPWPAEICLSLS